MKKRILGALCAVLLFVITGCSTDAKLDDTGTFIYNISSDGNALNKMEYHIVETDEKKAITSMLDALAKKPNDIEYKSAIPSDVKVLNFEIQDKQLQLNFNGAYANLSEVEEVLCRAAVVQSLVQIKGIEYVSFYVEEAPIINNQGVPIGLMSKDDFVKNTGTSVHSYQAATLQLYFANKAGDKLVKETVHVKYSSNMSMEKLIVERLMKGPDMDEAYPVIPKETKLLGISIKNGICYVNFDKEFLTTTYDLKPKIPIYAIANSLIEGANVNQVQILINGETDAVYLGEINLKEPLERNLELVEESETK